MPRLAACLILCTVVLLAQPVSTSKPLEPPKQTAQAQPATVNVLPAAQQPCHVEVQSALPDSWWMILCKYLLPVLLTVLGMLGTTWINSRQNEESRKHLTEENDKERSSHAQQQHVAALQRYRIETYRQTLEHIHLMQDHLLTMKEHAGSVAHRIPIEYSSLYDSDTVELYSHTISLRLAGCTRGTQELAEFANATHGKYPVTLPDVLTLSLAVADLAGRLSTAGQYEIWGDIELLNDPFQQISRVKQNQSPNRPKQSREERS
jgi:hypothetical protein